MEARHLSRRYCASAIKVCRRRPQEKPSCLRPPPLHCDQHLRKFAINREAAIFGGHEQAAVNWDRASAIGSPACLAFAANHQMLSLQHQANS